MLAVTVFHDDRIGAVSKAVAGPLHGYHDDEVRVGVIEVGKIEAEVAPRKFGRVILVVEYGILSKALRENCGDLRDKLSFFPREAEGDAESFFTHTVKNFPQPTDRHFNPDRTKANPQ